MKCANETVTIELKNGVSCFVPRILDFVVTACCLRREALLVSRADLNFADSALAHSKTSKRYSD